MAKRRIVGRDMAKERDWRRRVMQWDKSGQTIAGFCRKSKLSPSAFQWWRRELARRDGRPVRRLRKRASLEMPTKRQRGPMPKSVSFVPIHLNADLPQGWSTDTIEIELPGRRLVRVGSGVSSEALAMVINVLEGKRC